MTRIPQAAIRNPYTQGVPQVIENTAFARRFQGDMQQRPLSRLQQQQQPPGIDVQLAQSLLNDPNLPPEQQARLQNIVQQDFLARNPQVAEREFHNQQQFERQRKAEERKRLQELMDREESRLWDMAQTGQMSEEEIMAAYTDLENRYGARIAKPDTRVLRQVNEEADNKEIALANTVEGLQEMFPDAPEKVLSNIVKDEQSRRAFDTLMKYKVQQTKIEEQREAATGRATSPEDALFDFRMKRHEANKPVKGPGYGLATRAEETAALDRSLAEWEREAERMIQEHYQKKQKRTLPADTSTEGLEPPSAAQDIATRLSTVVVESQAEYQDMVNTGQLQTGKPFVSPSGRIMYVGVDGNPTPTPPK
jgi:hypothetical protein